MLRHGNIASVASGGLMAVSCVDKNSSPKQQKQPNCDRARHCSFAGACYGRCGFVGACYRSGTRGMSNSDASTQSQGATNL
eukprot:1161633-Pelagomonas_calceolata.AAC.4